MYQARYYINNILILLFRTRGIIIKEIEFQTNAHNLTKTMTKTHIIRIMNDVREFYEDPPKNIFIVPEEENICVLHALVIGPPETPYEGGFFYFVLR